MCNDTNTIIMRYVNEILMSAIKKDVSHIHFEPYKNKLRIRFRKEQVLYEIASPPACLSQLIITKLKAMSNLNIAECRIPQYGLIKIKLFTKNIDFNISTLPTSYGEKIVLHLLNISIADLRIKELGMDNAQREILLQAIKQPSGMIIVSGHHGSGKTVSLYAILHFLNKPEVNICTIEQTIELAIPGINQVGLSSSNLTYATALKSVLLQDPDIIMLDGLEDPETLKTTITAAQTGHLVLLSLYTRDAPQTLTRLANMGVPPCDIASTVLLVIAQRTLPRLCKYCKVLVKNVPNDVLLQEGFSEKDVRNGVMLYRAHGCTQCKRGYKGRVGVFEVMPVTEAVSSLVVQGGNSYQLADQAADDGVINLRQSGIFKIKAGLASLEELIWATRW